MDIAALAKAQEVARAELQALWDKVVKGVRHRSEALPISQDVAYMTQLTSPVPMGKPFHKDANGEVVKGKQINFFGGAFQVRIIRDLSGLASLVSAGAIADADAPLNIRPRLTTRDLLVPSLPKPGWGGVASNEIRRAGGIVREENAVPDKICRTTDYLDFPAGQAGVVILDYDPQEGKEPLSKEALWDAIKEACPGIQGAIWRPSSSSLIYHGDEQVKALGGQRLYLLTQDLADTKRFIDTVHTRLILKGYGYAHVTKGGILAFKSLVDVSMGKRAQVDYAGGAVLPKGWRQDIPVEILGDVAAPFLDTRAACPDLTPEEDEAFEAFKSKAREENGLALKKVKDAQAKKYPAGGGVSWERKSGGMEIPKLGKNVVIHLAAGGSVTGGEILANPLAYHGEETLDPLEPEYDDGRAVGKLFTAQEKPAIHSFAHGGYTSFLEVEVHCPPYGDKSLVARDLANALAAHPTFYRYAGCVGFMEPVDKPKESKEFVPVRRCVWRPLQTKEDVSNYAVNKAWYGSIDETGKRKTSTFTPQILSNCLRLLSQREASKDRNIRAIATMPFVVWSGATPEIVTKPGFIETPLGGVYGDFAPSEFSIFEKPSRQQLEQAAGDIQSFFAGCCFDESEDDGHSFEAAAYASAFLAVLRGSMRLAPGVCIEASMQGTGKTFIAQKLEAVFTGSTQSALTTWTTEEELRKHVTSISINGKSSLLVDNLTGYVRSGTLSACLTSATWEVRALGGNSLVSSTIPVLMLFTGNNPKADADMLARLLFVRLKKTARTASEAESPTTLGLMVRRRLCSAVLTLVAGYVQAGGLDGLLATIEKMKYEKEEDDEDDGITGWLPEWLSHVSESSRFPEWDALCRYPVIWAIQQGLLKPGKKGDPGYCFLNPAKDMASEREEEFLLRMAAVLARFKRNTPWQFTAYEVEKFCSQNPDCTEVKALEALMRDRVTSIALTNWLTNLRGRIYFGGEVSVVLSGLKPQNRIGWLIKGFNHLKAANSQPEDPGYGWAVPPSVTPVKGTGLLRAIQ
jgi:hypothetical protein